MSRIVLLDTETTSLRHDRRAWDIALIQRSDRGEHREQWLIAAEDLDLGNADPKSLSIGRFYARHPHARGAVNGVEREAYVLRKVEQLTRGAHVVGLVPSFDAEVLATRMRANGICPSWHYHLVDAETLAAGFLRGRGEKVSFPFQSDEISRRIGVEPPGDDERHTAMADARWAMGMWDAVMRDDE